MRERMRRPPHDLGLDGEAWSRFQFLPGFGPVGHVFNVRQPASGVLANGGTHTRYDWAAVGFCILLLLGAVYIPGVGHVLEVQPPGAEAWGLIALMSLVPLGVEQVVLLVRWHFGSPRENKAGLK